MSVSRRTFLKGSVASLALAAAGGAAGLAGCSAPNATPSSTAQSNQASKENECATDGFRFLGEWEPQTDVFVNWPLFSEPLKGYSTIDPACEIIRHLMDEVQVHVNCCPSVTGQLDSCIEALTKAGIDTDRIKFNAFNENPIHLYFRDNGPNVMVNDEGETLVVNPHWSFYGNNSKDDDVSTCSRKAGVQAAIELGCYDIISSDVVSEGGDREFNGAGVLIAIEDTEVRKRNPDYTKEQIEAEFKRIWNVQKIIWLPQPLIDDDDLCLGPLDYEEDGTPIFGISTAAHTDEMCRFVGKNKILLAEVTEEEAASNPVYKENKRRLDACYEILKDETDLEGNPFEIIRIPTPNHIKVISPPNTDTYDTYHAIAGDQFKDGTPFPTGQDLHLYAPTSYCNFVVCNNVVIGQRYWQEGMDEGAKAKDQKAEEVIQECFPDRKVVMVPTLAINLIGGGVHCWTKNVFIPSQT